MINIKDLDLNKIWIDEKSDKNTHICYIEYLMVKDLKYFEVHNVNTLYLIINKINGYNEQVNGNECFTLVPTNESKGIVKKFEELWVKIRDQIRIINNSTGNSDEKFMKIKFNSDEYLPLNKTLKLHNMVIIVRAVLHEDNKYYPQVF